MDEETTESSQRVADLLEAVEQGADGALDALVAEIYPDLKKLAHFQLAGERREHTLNTTAIVHEAFLRLAGGSGRYSDRAHFLRAAAKVMRHLLVDYARKRNAEKRGAGVEPVTLHDDRLGLADDTVAVLAMNTAMQDISTIDPRLEEVIECRYFAGLSVQDTADALGMSVRSVERASQRARGYLVNAMEAGDD